MYSIKTNLNNGNHVENVRLTYPNAVYLNATLFDLALKKQSNIGRHRVLKCL